MAKEVFHDGQLANGYQFSVFGRAENGEARKLERHITQVGEDMAVVLPDYNVVGVFDGAGGTADIGSPEQAALAASRAVAKFYENGGEDVASAMEFARQAVIHDETAGLCVGALLRMNNDGSVVNTVNAGDTAIFWHNPRQKVTKVLAEQQLNGCSQPSNFLGRRARRSIPKPIADTTASHQLRSADNELYISSDGVIGHSYGTLEDYHFDAAHDDYVYFRDGVDYLGSSVMEREVRSLLASEHGKEALRVQVAGNTRGDGTVEYLSPEFTHPESFRVDEPFDWEVWSAIVRPYLDTQSIPRRKLSTYAIGKALMTRPIAWPFERAPNDDATLVMLTNHK